MILKKHYTEYGYVEFESVDNVTFNHAGSVDTIKRGTTICLGPRHDTDIVVSLIDCGKVIYNFTLYKTEKEN